jgi:hypothetical protein
MPLDASRGKDGGGGLGARSGFRIKLSRYKPVALVRCPLRSIKNENSHDWTTVDEGGKVDIKVHVTRGFLQLEHAGDDKTGPEPSSSRC